MKQPYHISLPQDEGNATEEARRWQGAEDGADCLGMASSGCGKAVAPINTTIVAPCAIQTSRHCNTDGGGPLKDPPLVAEEPLAVDGNRGGLSHKLHGQS